MGKERKKDLNDLLELTKEKLRINQEVNQTYETLIESLKEYMGDDFETKLETYIFDRRYIQLIYRIGFEVLNKGHFTHSDLYARTSLSDRSIDRYISYMLEINWINELPSSSEDKRVKRYVWFPKEEVYRLLLKAEYDEQVAFKKFSEMDDSMLLFPDFIRLEEITNFDTKTNPAKKRD